MVNFSNVEIVRIIIHRVNPKVGDNDATVTPSDHLLILDEEAKTIIKDRLVTAFGRQSKSFELEIEKDEDDSCFGIVRFLHQVDEPQFIALSTNIAKLLANSQRQQRIPGGFLLVVQCKYEDKPLIVLIKAEPHQALGVSEMTVRTIRDIILSPEQKLYKAVYYAPKRIARPDEVLGKDDFQVVLFDSIVNFNNSIAQYFYKDFLGLTIQSNAELQTSLFYKKMDDRIWMKLDETDAMNASDLLRAEVMNNAHVTINPHEIITNVIPLEDRDEFMSIIDEFPQAFAKNTSLITTRLGKKSILLSDNVRITAPATFFEENVQVENGNDYYVVTIRRRQ